MQVFSFILSSKRPPHAEVLVMVTAYDRVINTLARLSKIPESSSPHQVQDLVGVAVRDILFNALGTEGLAQVLTIVSLIT